MVEGLPEPPQAQTPTAAVNRVDPTYFETLGIELFEGRLLEESDRRDTRPVVVVNEELARRWPNSREAVGRAIRTGRPGDQQNWSTEIVGVVGNVRQNGLDEEPTMEMFVSRSQFGATSARFVVRTSGEPLAMMETVRRTVRRAAPSLPLDELRTMDQVVDAGLASRRLLLSLFVSFALLAIVLATTGLYGVVAYSVVQRTREIGLRMAIGAQRSDVLKLVLRREFTLIFAAIACGALASAAVGSAMQGVLFGVGAHDPGALAFSAAALLAAALAACYFPARRATRVQPAVALNEE